MGYLWKLNVVMYKSAKNIASVLMIKWNEVKVTQSCPILCDPMDYTVHGILHARILEWVAFSFCRGSSQPRDQTQVSHIAGRFFTNWGTREAQKYWSGEHIPSPVDLPNPRIEPHSTCIADGFLISWAKVKERFQEFIFISGYCVKWPQNFYW